MCNYAQCSNYAFGSPLENNNIKLLTITNQRIYTMKYTSQDISALIEEVKGQDDVIGHCSSWGSHYNTSICLEDSGSPIWNEDRR